LTALNDDAFCAVTYLFNTYLSGSSMVDCARSLALDNRLKVPSSQSTIPLTNYGCDWWISISFWY